MDKLFIHVQESYQRWVIQAPWNLLLNSVVEWSVLFDRTSYSVNSNLYFCLQDQVRRQIFGIELLYSMSSETLVWCFYKVLMKLISHIDFLIHSLNTWTFSTILRHQKSNRFKVSGGSHLPTASETIKQSRFTACHVKNSGSFSIHWKNKQSTT